MQVTLAKALKERSRLAGKLKRNFELINKENSKISGSQRSFDMHELHTECFHLHDQLTQLKKIIAKANAPIADKLVEMDELKSMISYLRNVNTTIGWQSQGYNTEKVCFEAILGSAELTAEADQLQKRAEQIQDELDEFNALTKVEIPDN
jgi:hypothetical protein